MSMLYFNRVILSLLFIVFSVDYFSQEEAIDKINGVNYVSPRTETSYGQMVSVKRIAAEWIAVTPFTFIDRDSLRLIFDDSKNWYGDSFSGIEKTIEEAQSLGLKVLLKPHFIMDDFSWVGDFELKGAKKNKTNRRNWELQYSNYILDLAKLAESKKVEILAIGTELKLVVNGRAEFWSDLIDSVRLVYNGDITYAANWDNFSNISFWDKLDYIGIDAYFPLSADKSPGLKELSRKWQPIVKRLQGFSSMNNKKILFTEFGYRSTNKCSWEQWKIEGVPSDESVNLGAQEIAYSALFQSVWDKDWFAGGFIWKWWPEDKTAGGLTNSGYSPQHKPVEDLIKQYYK